MALLTASDLHKDIAGQPLLRGVSFKLERRDRMTIAGRNGAGKTTLLRMLAGESTIDRGELSLAKGVRLALHDQRPPRKRAASLHDYVLSGCAEELEIEARLTALEAEMAAGGSDEALLARYAHAQARLEARGGYRWRDRATAMTHGLGFAAEDLERALDTFSGGELTRASLARALATGADVLLLDEPTNHLDIESLEWLERTLVELDAAVVLVAHDRWFLEAVGTSVLEIEAGGARFFAGSWHRWRKERAAREIALGRAIDSQRAEIARMERFIERFRYKATKARQVQSRVKKLARLERIERDPQAGKALAFAFRPPQRSGRVIFELLDARIEIGGGDSAAGGAEAAGGADGATRGNGAKRGNGPTRPDGPARGNGATRAGAEPGTSPIVLLRDAALWLERGEHVSLVGPNGSGKTTLLEILGGRRELAAGKLARGHNVHIGYLSQHADEIGAGGPRGQSALQAAQRATGLTPGKARALLGRFLFSGEEAEKPLEGLSGGERRRLSLAILVQGGANVLLLDEPTNHLDIESREALEDALRAFTGAVLLVSHDRALLDAVGTRTIAVEDGTLHSYAGGWAEYVRAREERRSLSDGAAAAAGDTPGAGAGAAAGAGARTASAKGSPADVPVKKPGARGGAGGKGGRGPKAPSKNRLRDQQKAERAVEEAEAALRAVEDELADPAAWATQYESAKSQARHTAARRAVEEAYTRLEALID
jgi:ATP-binding cassette subfamily F protein 3